MVIRLLFIAITCAYQLAFSMDFSMDGFLFYGAIDQPQPQILLPAVASSNLHYLKTHDGKYWKFTKATATAHAKFIRIKNIKQNVSVSILEKVGVGYESGTGSQITIGNHEYVYSHNKSKRKNAWQMPLLKSPIHDEKITLVTFGSGSFLAEESSQ